MKEFKYKSIQLNGEESHGKMSANDKDEVVKYLQGLGQYPVKIDEVNMSRDVRMDAFTKVKTKDLATFCKQLFTLLNAGVNLINSLNILKTQTENRKLREVISQVYDSIQKGMTLSEALAEQKDVFPNIMISMVAAGEATGNIDVVFDRLATSFDKENAIKTKITTALIYPAFITVFAILVVMMLIVFVLPTYVGMFSSAGVELPGPTQALLNISKFVRLYWLFIILGFIVLGYIVRRYRKTDVGKNQLDLLVMRLPIFKGIVQKLYTTRFTRTLSTLIGSGIPLIQALESVAKVSNNKPVEKVIIAAIEDVRRGVSLSIPIRNSNLFPPMVHYMLNIGEETGSIDSLLEKTADYFDLELEESIKKVMSLIEPMLIVVMAVAVGFVVIAIAMPMFDMMKTVQ